MNTFSEIRTTDNDCRYELYVVKGTAKNGLGAGLWIVRNLRPGYEIVSIVRVKQASIEEGTAISYSNLPGDGPMVSLEAVRKYESRPDSSVTACEITAEDLIDAPYRVDSWQPVTGEPVYQVRQLA